MTTLTGKFVWFELVTTDRAKAEAFYGEVLGWKTSSMPMGNESYTMLVNGPAPVGGVVAAEGKARPHWISYVAVPDVDAALAKVAPAGGKVLEPAFAVPTVGRMAKIADPQGAPLYLFRGEKADQESAPGTGGFTWNELMSSAPEAAVRFYEAVVGYRHESMDMGPAGTYHVLKHGDASRAGVTTTPPGAPDHWVPYVAVDDCDATAGRVKRNGGTIHVEPTDIPDIGRFAIFGDPTGATLAILQPAPRT